MGFDCESDALTIATVLQCYNINMSIEFPVSRHNKRRTSCWNSVSVFKVDVDSIILM